jgi:pyridoxamine 5'-phosphate oxidase
MDFEALRREYAQRGLDERELHADPLVQLRRWFDEAVAHGLLLPDAMTLATTGTDGAPDARVVLMRGLDERGIVFFTNYRSAKGRELEADPRAVLVFWWGALERQVRVRGRVGRVEDVESDGYWATRPRGSQVGAWASMQSEPLPDRMTLERVAREVERRWPDGPLPRPPHWGGFRLVPGSFEFWQGRLDRLHDRFSYTRADRGWAICRLAP